MKRQFTLSDVAFAMSDRGSFALMYLLFTVAWCENDI